jgi:hypothetical protein
MPGHVVGVKQKDLCFLALGIGYPGHQNTQAEKGHKKNGSLQHAEAGFPKFLRRGQFSFQLFTSFGIQPFGKAGLSFPLEQGPGGHFEWKQFRFEMNPRSFPPKQPDVI